jgi:Ni/Co efflux regulator RcnB
MKRTLLALAALATVAAAPLAAQAAPWQTINQRQANLEHRIDQGVRNGSLTRSKPCACAASSARSAAWRPTIAGRTACRCASAPTWTPASTA